MTGGKPAPPRVPSACVRGAASGQRPPCVTSTARRAGEDGGRQRMTAEQALPLRPPPRDHTTAAQGHSPAGAPAAVRTARHGHGHAGRTCNGDQPPPPGPEKTTQDVECGSGDFAFQAAGPSEFDLRATTVGPAGSQEGERPEGRDSLHSPGPRLSSARAGKRTVTGAPEKPHPEAAAGPGLDQVFRSK